MTAACIPRFGGPLPWLTAEQMVVVDRLMVEEAHILLVQMMESAGRNLAHVARVRFLGGDPTGRDVTVLAGTGGNGGGALVCARRLAAWGARVRILVTAPDERFGGVPGHQLDVARRIGLRVERASALGAGSGTDLVVDGVIGYSLRGAPHGDAAVLIHWANTAGAPVLSLDVPSGLHATTGEPSEPTVRATATLTLALPKVGLRAPAAAPFVGDLYLGDIGVPPSLYAAPELNLVVPAIFAERDVVRLDVPSQEGGAP